MLIFNYLTYLKFSSIASWFKRVFLGIISQGIQQNKIDFLVCVLQTWAHLVCGSWTYMQDALRTFLLRKLDNLAKDDKCQITMISTWATELYLDKVLLLYFFNSWIRKLGCCLLVCFNLRYLTLRVWHDLLVPPPSLRWFFHLFVQEIVFRTHSPILFSSILLSKSFSILLTPTGNYLIF